MKSRTIRILGSKVGIVSLIAGGSFTLFNSLTGLSTYSSLRAYEEKYDDVSRKCSEIIDSVEKQPSLIKSAGLGVYLAARNVQQNPKFGQARPYEPIQRKSGDFNGLPVEIATDRYGRRSIRIWENELFTRGSRPAMLFARDAYPKTGFEYIELHNAIDLLDASAPTKENPLKNFNDPVLCERIYEYVAVGGDFKKNPSGYKLY